jgi:hypothetical protein
VEPSPRDGGSSNGSSTSSVAVPSSNLGAEGERARTHGATDERRQRDEGDDPHRLTAPVHCVMRFCRRRGAPPGVRGQWMPMRFRLGLMTHTNND